MRLIYQTINQELTKVKSYIEEFREQEANIEYCPYCTERRDNKHSCCQENHFVPFSDLDDQTQMEIIKEEYDNAYADHK